MVPSLQWRIWAWMRANRQHSFCTLSYTVTKCVRWKERQKWLRKQCMCTCVCVVGYMWVWWCLWHALSWRYWETFVYLLLALCLLLPCDGESQASGQLMDDLMIYTQWKNSEETLTCISLTSVPPFAHPCSNIHPTIPLRTTSVLLICICVFATVLWDYWFLSELKMAVSVAT